MANKPDAILTALKTLLEGMTGFAAGQVHRRVESILTVQPRPACYVIASRVVELAKDEWELIAEIGLAVTVDAEAGDTNVLAAIGAAHAAIEGRDATLAAEIATLDWSIIYDARPNIGAFAGAIGMLKLHFDGPLITA